MICRLYLAIREPARTQYLKYLKKHFPNYSIIPVNTEDLCTGKEKYVKGKYKLEKEGEVRSLSRPESSGEAAEAARPGSFSILLCDSDQGLEIAAAAKWPRIAISHPGNRDESLMNAPWMIDSPSVLTQRFLCEIYCRYRKLPLTILCTDKFKVRELDRNDLNLLLQLQLENTGNPAACFFPETLFSETCSAGTEEDLSSSEPAQESSSRAARYLENYISHQYPFYGYGFYAIEESIHKEMQAERDDLAGKALGIAGFYDGKEGIEIGYALLKQYQGRGILSEILPALIQYGIEQYEFDTIRALIKKENTASLKLARKCGLKIIPL